LGELYNLLPVEALRTSPCHPQMDGLVERFNQTLKQMLKKMASSEGKIGTS
jgi:transposase InsO family protein